MKTMNKLANDTGLTFDGGGDTRLFKDDMLDVFVHLMTAKQYKQMEKDLRNALIKRRLYEVYAWNDCSGYKYWKAEGESGFSNYIQITVNIKTKNLHKIDIEQLKQDVQDLENKLYKYHNLDKYMYTFKG